MLALQGAARRLRGGFLHPVSLLALGYLSMAAAAHLEGFDPGPEAAAFMLVGVGSAAAGSWSARRFPWLVPPLASLSSAAYLLSLFWGILGPAAALPAVSMVAALWLMRTARPPGIRLARLVYLLGISLTLVNPILNLTFLGGPPRSIEPPLEAAAGPLLTALSFPWVLAEVQAKDGRRAGLILTALTAATALSTGFRADAVVILLEAALICASRNRRGEAAMTLAAALLLFVVVGVLRASSHPAAVMAWDPVRRAATSMGYFYELSSLSWPLGIFEDPLFLLRQFRHPSQVIGRGILGRGTGITPTAFGTDVVSFGLPELIVVWFLLGSALEALDERRISGDPRPHSLAASLIIVSLDVGLTQAVLFVVLAAAAAVRVGERSL